MIRFLGRRRPWVTGLILGTALGLMIAVGYGGTSAWLCSGISKCPASWQPFVLVSSIIFGLVLVATMIVAIFGAKLYKIFDTSIGGDKAYAGSGGRAVDRDDDNA
jgi:hypothetical protein